MSQVVSFSGYRPPERFDGLPWTDAQIEESTDETGPWTVIDTVALDPLDSNPAAPRLRNITTELATDTPDLWYRIVFLDADGDESQPTVAVQNTSDLIATTAASLLCTGWLDGADIADCCEVEVSSDNEALLNEAALEAAELLYELSGRQFPGICERTVRPCNQHPCGFQTLSRGHIVPELGWNGWRWGGYRGTCGCAPLSKVRLAGPVIEVVEVKIDGDVIDPAEYGLVNGSLYRKATSGGSRQLWPSCQRLDLDDSEAGTFSVTYTWGGAPPLAGVAAARELGCELYRACPGNDAEGECKIPAGVVRVIRQGITFERDEVRAFLTTPPTGLVLVDAFLAAPYRRARRAAVWSPDAQPFAKELR